MILSYTTFDFHSELGHHGRKNTWWRICVPHWKQEEGKNNWKGPETGYAKVHLLLPAVSHLLRFLELLHIGLPPGDQTFKLEPVEQHSLPSHCRHANYLHILAIVQQTWTCKYLSEILILIILDIFQFFSESYYSRNSHMVSKALTDLLLTQCLLERQSSLRIGSGWDGRVCCRNGRTEGSRYLDWFFFLKNLIS